MGNHNDKDIMKDPHPYHLRIFAQANGIVMFLMIGLASAALWAEEVHRTEADVQAVRSFPRPQDKIWLISTRDSLHNNGFGRQDMGLKYYQYDPESGSGIADWSTSDLTTFLEQNTSDTSIVFYVHGNRVAHGEDRQRALTMYRDLIRHAVAPRPILFVTWSWPTARLKGHLRDVRVKAYRSGRAGYQLAWLLDQLGPEASLSMIGYSFGARVITGALHVLGQGRLGSLHLETRKHPMPKSTRVVLLTGALHDDWLLPKRYHGRALSQIDQILILYNPCDPAMKWYPIIDRHCRSFPIGRWGLSSCGNLSKTDRLKIEQRNVCGYLGRSHDLSRYLCSPSLMSQVWSHLLP